MHFDLNSNLTSIIALIGILTANIILVINAVKSNTNKAEIKDKLQEIHTSTNGNLSELKLQISALEKKDGEFQKQSMLDKETVQSLKEVITTLKK